MRYQGGKHIAAKWIAGHIRNHEQRCYLEPFVGGASVMAQVAPGFGTAIGADSSVDLILCWQAVCLGWVPPVTMDRDQYEALRNAEPSALRGFTGYACSYGGGWFNGYAPPSQPRPRVPYGEDFARSGSRSCVRKGVTMTDVIWTVADYRAWRPGEGWVVYADPPYAGVREHRQAFDSGEFWSVMEAWAEAGADVLVSEYEAPDGWTCLAEMDTPRKMESNKGQYQTERLWVKM